MEKNNNSILEFNSYFEKNIKNIFKDFEYKIIKPIDENKKAIYFCQKIGNINEVIFVKQIKLESNNIKKVLKEIYFLGLLSNEIFFSKLDRIKISEDNKYVFLIFSDNKISLNLIMNALPNNLDLEFIQFAAFYTCLSLYYLQINHIVHNDIKPSNILHGFERPYFYLCDFGAMRYEGELPKEYTKYYVAPEFFNSKTNNKSDMWSLGIMMIEMFYKIIFKIDKEKIKKFIEFLLELGIKEVYDSSKEKENKINYEKIKEIVKDENAFHLIEKLVVYNPDNRYSAEEALKSDYFFDLYKNEKFEIKKLEKLDVYEKINKLKDGNAYIEITKELVSKLKINQIK